jgi:hypothetical protein
MKFEPSLLVIWVAPLRRKTTGAFTPKTPWLHYAGNPVAPLRRKRNGAYMPEIHTPQTHQAGSFQHSRKAHPLSVEIRSTLQT